MSQENGSIDRLFLYVDAGEEADVEELDQLSRQLRSELEDLDVGTVDFVSEREIPAGAKTAEAVTWGALAVTVLPAVLPKLVEFLQSWVMRADERKVKIKTVTGDQTIEIEYPTKGVAAKDLEMLVKAMTGAPAAQPEAGEQLEKDEQPAELVKPEAAEKPKVEEKSEAESKAEQETKTKQESKLEEETKPVQEMEPEAEQKPPAETHEE
jgi:hypothetical protein